MHITKRFLVFLLGAATLTEYAWADESPTKLDVAACEMLVIQVYPSVEAVDWPKPAQNLMYACMRSKGYEFSLSPPMCMAPMPFVNEPCYYVDTLAGRKELEQRLKAVKK